MRLGLAWTVAGAFAVAAPIALAQTLDIANLREVDDDATISYEGLSVDQLEDMDVVRDGENIGEIEEILANADDQIVAVVVEYDDGFLELNEKEVVLPIERLQFDGNADEASVMLSDTELEALPVWDE